MIDCSSSRRPESSFPCISGGFPRTHLGRDVERVIHDWQVGLRVEISTVPSVGEYNKPFSVLISSLCFPIDRRVVSFRAFNEAKIFFDDCVTKVIEAWKDGIKLDVNFNPINEANA
jgi:hypothetical protein